jgi:predicted TIM-barrel fold metal-dependent hydrolase
LSRFGRLRSALGVELRHQGALMDQITAGRASGGGLPVNELAKITVKSDTRDILAHAPPLDDYFIVDCDAHMAETAFWSDIIDRLDSDVLQHIARSFKDRGGMNGALVNTSGGMLFQDVAGRIPHQQQQGEAVTGNAAHKQVVLSQRAMDSMGIDYMIVFPTAMLTLGMHPVADIEVALGWAFNRWMVSEVLRAEPRIKALLYLPFNEPEACLEIVDAFKDEEGVVGFSITATRHRAVHHNSYMPLYGKIQEAGKTLAFHSGFHWGDPSLQQCNRFLSMHAISFVHYNLVHLTNWIINGLPERFPNLKMLWIESGLAWLPFIMQRLDAEYLMRSSEAPLLRKLPSEYINQMHFSSQPLERSNMKLTAATFEAIRAETQLLFSSDWPHWDFDLPHTITTLPFLSEQAKRNILGLNAAKLFDLKIPEKKLAKKPAPAHLRTTA